jgi:hypothetical protein
MQKARNSLQTKLLTLFKLEQRADFEDLRVSLFDWGAALLKRPKSADYYGF